jgi:hypothetical protein
MTSELTGKFWAVILESAVVKSGLTYDDAVVLRDQYSKTNTSACVVTNAVASTLMKPGIIKRAERKKKK